MFACRASGWVGTPGGSRARRDQVTVARGDEVAAVGDTREGLGIHGRGSDGWPHRSDHVLAFPQVRNRLPDAVATTCKTVTI